MKRHRVTSLALVGALLLASVAAARQPAVATKFITPIKGQALIELTAPQARAEGNMVVTHIKVKNVSKGPIAGFKVDEYWYNAKGEAVSGSQPFRSLKPFMPGDILDVTFEGIDVGHPGVAPRVEGEREVAGLAQLCLLTSNFA